VAHLKKKCPNLLEEEVKTHIVVHKAAKEPLTVEKQPPVIILEYLLPLLSGLRE
jgi:hypothetical protein